jgi:ubiquinone biosynthesis protein UbiJ
MVSKDIVHPTLSRLSKTMTIKPLLISAFEAALNKYLSLDEDVAIFLKPLQGKIIAVTITPFNETMYLCPNSENIQIIDYYLGNIDTTITGSLPALGLMGLSSTPARSFFSGEVSITGDLSVGHQFQSLIQSGFKCADKQRFDSHRLGESGKGGVNNIFAHHLRH